MTNENDNVTLIRYGNIPQKKQCKTEDPTCTVTVLYFRT